MSTDTFILEPTVLVVDDGERFGFVTVNDEGIEALMVFRGPEDATRFQRYTGKHGPEEGYMRIGMDHEAIASVLEKQGLGYVAMPEPWTGKDGVDLFTGENFIRFLEGCREV